MPELPEKPLFSKEYYTNLVKSYNQLPVGGENVGDILTSRYDEDVSIYNLPNLNRIRAEKQPWYHQAGESILQVVNEATLGTVQSLAALGDLPSYQALLNNNETSDIDFHNSVYDWAKSAKESINEEIPIYSGDRFDSGWFWKGLGQTIGSAASFYIPGMGAAKLLGKLGEIVKLGTTASKTLQTLGGAAIMRHAENFQEASSMFDSTYQSAIDFGKSHEEAIDLASEAAASNYKMNRANYVFDVLQMGAILKPKFGSALGLGERQPYKVLKAANLLPESKLGRLGKWVVDPAKGILEAGSEGLEEVVNTVSQFEATRDADIKMGKISDDGSDFTTRLGKYLGNEDLQDSFIWGMVGGAAFKGLALVTGTDENSQEIKNKLEELSTRPETLKAAGQYIAEINTNTKLTPEQKKEKLQKLDEDLAFDLGLSTAKARTTNILLQQLNQPEFIDQFVQAGLGTKEEIEGKIPTIKENIQKAAYLYDKHYNRFFKSPISRMAKDMLIDESIGNEKILSDNLKILQDLRSDYARKLTIDPELQYRQIDPAFVETSRYSGIQKAKEKVKLILAGAEGEAKTKYEKIYKNLETEEKALNNELITSRFKENPLVDNLAEQYLIEEINDVISKDLEDLNTPKAKKEAEEVVTKLKEKIASKITENKNKVESEEKQARVQETRDKVTPKEVVKEPVQPKEEFIDNEQTKEVNIPTTEVEPTPEIIPPIDAARQDIKTRQQEEITKAVTQLQGQDPEFIKGVIDNINLKYNTELKELEDAFGEGSKNIEELNTEETAAEVNIDKTNYDVDKYKEATEAATLTEQELDKVNAEKEVDVDGSITYDYYRSKNGFNLGAYLQRLFKQTWVGNVIKREDIDDNLNPDFNKELLDYNKYNRGTEVTISVEDRDDIQVYIPGTKELTTWGALKPTVNFNEFVPLVVKDADGNKLFYIHSTDWINDTNLYGDLVKDKENLVKVRDYIVKNGEYKTIISSRANGSLFTVKKGNPLVTVDKAMQDPNLQLGVALDENGSIKIGRNKAYEGDLHAKNTRTGVTYVMVKLNKDFVTALPVFNEKIGGSNIESKIVDSISTAIEVFYKKDKLTLELQKVKELIQSNNGLNVTTIEGLEDYLKQFINLYNTGKGTLKDLMKLESFHKGKPDTKHLIAIKDKVVYFTHKGATYNLVDNDKLDEFLGKLKSMIPNMYFSVNSDNLGTSANVTYFNYKDGVISGTEGVKYNDFVKQHTKTNVLSFEVSPGVYSYTVQPKIRLDFSNILTEEETVITPEVPKPVEPVENTNKKDILKAIRTANGAKPITVIFKDGTKDNVNPLNRVSDEGEVLLLSGNIADISTIKEVVAEYSEQYKIPTPKKEYKKTNFDYDESFSPATITPLEANARKYVIRELGFAKQEQLTNFLTREVVKEIVANKDVNPNTIYANFKAKFESDIADLDENITLATESNDEANLKKFQGIKSMLEPIVSNWSLIEKFADFKLARIQNIKFDFNDDVDLDMQDYEESERNNWDQHQATVDDKKSMSKEVKLFLSDINRTTPDGKIKKTFFGLPDVMDYNEVYNNLQAVTSGYKPDIEILLAAIESNIKNQPWMAGIRDKLLKASKRQRNLFVRTMTKHSKQMDGMRYSIDNNGNFNYKMQDSNSSAKQKIVQENWLHAAEGNTKLTYLDEDGYYKMYTDENSIKEQFVNRFDELKAKPELRTTQNIMDWLAMIGIELSPLAANDLRDYKNKKLKFAEQFTDKNGIFLNLRNSVQKWGDSPLEGNDSLYNNIAIQDLAYLESKYNLQVHSNSFRSGNKQVYSYGKNNYAINRIRDLKNNKQLQSNLSKLAFSKNSLWLKNLIEGTLADNLNISVVDLEAFNEFGNKNKNNKELHNQTPANIERVKIGFLQASQRDYSGSTIAKRIITLLYPTTSDKTTPYKIRTEAVTIGFNKDGSITNKFIDEVLYKQLVLPEIDRIRVFEELKANGKLSELNHAEYEKAGFRFMMLPEINTIEGVFINGKLNPNLQQDEVIQTAIRNKIREYVDSIVTYKLQNWDKFGIGKPIKDSNGKVTTEYNYLDNRFLKDKKSPFKGVVDNNSLVKAAATDMVVQYLVGNANVFMTIIGDPAQFYKSKNTDPVIQAEDTFINIGKRLAGDIAPRDESVASVVNTYKQAVVADKNSQSLILKQLKELIGDKADKYESFDGTDAQEVTTLLERLYLMENYGEVNGQALPEGFYDAVAPIIQREIDSGNHYYDEAVIAELNKVNPEWVEVYKDLVFQPTKPVYQENIADLQLGVERRVYIKSSDYPLVPSATKGFEIDKLRIQMEKEGISRLAFKTAVKVGSVKSPAKIFNEDGTIIDNIDWTNSTLMLPRSGFGYQQEVPYNPMKKAINRVSQASKNLFNNILNVNNFVYKDRVVNGEELQKIYHDLYDKLFKFQKEELIKRLTTSDGAFNIAELKELLKEEIQKRDYPINDADALDLDEALTFMAYSPAADKYESLLNSIIQNKIIKTEFAGKSFVVASEEGWQIQEGKSISESGIVFTKSFTDKLQPNQAIIPFKFRDNEGNLLHLEDYVTDGFLDTNKLPKEILNVLVMRIPNQGLNSQRAIEIVGFLPHSSGDTIICSRDLVVQMGQDFDVDKLYTYMYNTHLSKDGKLSKEVKDVKQVLQNEILDIHLAIHNNQDPKVQKQIVEPLGFWILPELSRFVANARKTRFATSLKFTGLSDEYQKQKFINATAGKSGVGVFSVDSTFNAIAQGKNLLLTSENKPVEMVIGDEVFTGDLSSELGLDGKTYKSDIIAGFQSAAVDNEKEQILDKLNINTYTFKAYKFFNQAGFTNGTLLVSQDIIFDYVEEIARLKSEGYVPNVEDVAYRNVAERYKYGEVDTKPSELTEAKLKDMIENGSASENYNNYQRQVLDLFTQADAYGQIIQTVQSVINTDSKGLDKNLFGTLVKEQQISLLANSPIKNATALLGEFNKEGKLTKPTTLNGQAIYYGLYTNNELWSRFFPYQQTFLKKMFGQAEQIFGTEEKSTGKRADFQRKVWNAFKSYLYSNIEFGLTKDVTAERQRLFFGDNSLAKRIEDLQAQDKWANHPLISKLQIQPGEPSLLKFNAVSKENSSDVNVYVSFIDLFQQEETIELAKDLVTAAYLSGGIQEAIQYIKYIPVSYLHELPFGKELARTVEERLFDQNKYIEMPTGTSVPYYNLPNFLVQYAQHNPNTLTKLSDDKQYTVITGNRKEFETVNSIYLTDSELNVFRFGKPVAPEFLTVYDGKRKKGINKNHIFQHTGEYKLVNNKNYPVYNRVDNLGTFGFSEYDANLQHGVQNKTLLQPKIETKVTPKMDIPTTNTTPVASVENKQTNTLNIKSGGKKELLQAIQDITINSNDPYYKVVAQEILDNADKLPELTFKYETLDVKGKWNESTKTMYLDNSLNRADTEDTLLHETLHALTVNFINLYNNNKQQLIQEKNPELMRALVSIESLWKQYREHLIKTDPKGLEQFEKDFKNKVKLGTERISKYYGAYNMKEFISQAFTDRNFQRILNELEYKGEHTWWDKFTDQLQKFFNALGFDVKEGSMLKVAIDDILFIVKQEPIVETIEQGEVIESLSPMTNIPSANEILKQFKELNPDGSRKLLAHSEKDIAEDTRRQIVMNKRAQAINAGQPYYKATVGTTFGEGVSQKGKKFYYISLELRNFDNFAERVKLISDKEVQDRIKFCKGR